MTFIPTFQLLDPVDVAIRHAAEIINAPHEPKAVSQTANNISLLYGMYVRDFNFLSDNNIYIPAHMVRAIHRSVCSWLPDNERGYFRMVDITINDQRIGWMQIESDMNNLSTKPIAIASTKQFEQDIIEWYKTFQEIHPFADGNGRVGGTIVAALSLAVLGNIMVPNQ